MIERIRFLQINGNHVEDGNVESSLLELQEKLNELIDAVNEINRQQRNRNFMTHKNITKVGEGELAFCEDCHGGEVELYDASCGQRTGREIP